MDKKQISPEEKKQQELEAEALKSKKQEEESLQTKNLNSLDPQTKRELGRRAFLLSLKLHRNLTKLKLVQFGLTSKEIQKLVDRNFLTEERDPLTGLCYYSVTDF